MEENIMQTSVLTMLLFVGAMKFHGDDDPSFTVKAIEVCGFLFSFIAFFVSALFLIWKV